MGGMESTTGFYNDRKIVRYADGSVYYPTIYEIPYHQTKEWNEALERMREERGIPKNAPFDPINSQTNSSVHPLPTTSSAVLPTEIDPDLADKKKKKKVKYEINQKNQDEQENELKENNGHGEDPGTGTGNNSNGSSSISSSSGSSSSGHDIQNSDSDSDPKIARSKTGTGNSETLRKSRSRALQDCIGDAYKFLTGRRGGGGTGCPASAPVPVTVPAPAPLGKTLNRKSDLNMRTNTSAGADASDEPCVKCECDFHEQCRQHGHGCEGGASGGETTGTGGKSSLRSYFCPFLFDSKVKIPNVHFYRQIRPSRTQLNNKVHSRLEAEARTGTGTDTESDTDTESEFQSHDDDTQSAIMFGSDTMQSSKKLLSESECLEHHDHNQMNQKPSEAEHRPMQLMSLSLKDKKSHL